MTSTPTKSPPLMTLKYIQEYVRERLQVGDYIINEHTPPDKDTGEITVSLKVRVRPPVQDV